MHGLFSLAVATAATLFGSSLAIPIDVAPAPAGGFRVATGDAVHSNSTPAVNGAAASGALKITLHNNYGDNMNAYVLGQDIHGNAVMVTPDGQFLYPNPGGSKVPQPIGGNIAIKLGPRGQATDVHVPDYLISGRVYVAQGELKFFSLADDQGNVLVVQPSVTNAQDPSAGVLWAFVELTNNAQALYANVSFVDFVSIAMSLTLTLGSGEVQTVRGVGQGALAGICNDLRAQAHADGQPWDQLCVSDGFGGSGALLRVLSPATLLATPGNGDLMRDYWSDYVDRVWARYAGQDLRIASEGGDRVCRASGDALTCQGGAGRAYVKPTALDIFGCNAGPFANLGGDPVVPSLCAAFHRSTLLRDGGDVQPGLGSAAYYQANPTNHYSRVVHKYEVDNKGYAFPYDDVNPAGENSAGVVAGPNPSVLEVFVGGI